MQIFLRWFCSVLTLLGLLGLSACQKDGNIVLIPDVKLQQISFSADPNMNDNRVVTIHLVAPKVTALYEELLKMDAQTYFASIEQLQKDYPNDLEVFSWEIIPGGTLNKQTVRFTDFRAKGVIVFARYDDNISGSHRLVLPQQKAVKILLGRNDCSLAYD